VGSEPHSAAYEDLSDHALMERVAGRERAALAVLVRRHQEKVIGLALRFLGRREAAEDICQDAFVRVFERAGSYQPTAQFTTWLYRIVANLCWDHRRRARREPLSLDSESSGANASEASAPVERRERQQRIRQAVAELPDRQRLALVLHRFQGLGHKEIAAATGWSTSAVESCLVRAYGRLRELLADLSED
jgi:RNA polymerase sigma-70 factor (ECF subfamily)